MTKAQIKERTAKIAMLQNKEETDIEVDEFLALYPPRRDCKHCHGRGYLRHIMRMVNQITGKPEKGQDDDTLKRQLKFCSCVWNKYLRTSEEIYHIYVEDANGERDYLLL